MGYFNFYFLIKLLRNKNIRKFLIFLIIFLLLIFIKNNVFANFQFTHNNINYNLPDFPSDMNYSHKLIVRNTTGSTQVGKYYYYSSPTPIYIVKTSLAQSGFGFKSDSVIKSILYSYQYQSVTGFNNSSKQDITGTTLISNNYQDTFIYCTDTLSYTENGVTTTIYQGPEHYDNLPMFLNDSESIAIGGQSLVIMPRRFFKY